MEHAPRMDRIKSAMFKLGSEPKNCISWLSQSPKSRLEAVEFYRKQHSILYGTQSRLQRVYTKKICKKSSL